jgi:hypothetical protein
MLEDGLAIRYAFAREYGALLEGSPGVLNVTWFSAKRPIRGFRESKAFRCQPTAPRESYSKVGIFVPVFIDGTVTADVYFTLPNGEFVSLQ